MQERTGAGVRAGSPVPAPTHWARAAAGVALPRAGANLAEGGGREATKAGAGTQDRSAEMGIAFGPAGARMRERVMHRACTTWRRLGLLGWPEAAGAAWVCGA